MNDEKPSRPRIAGYGEDSLTLWALKYRLPQILGALGDQSSHNRCDVLYRPGFGRKGGDGSAEFGEFDYLIMSPTRLYLGESKWNRSGEVRRGVFTIRPEQEVRHALFRQYVTDWFKFHNASGHGTICSWNQFVDWAPSSFKVLGKTKRIAPRGSQTSKSLFTVLERTWNYYRGRCPEIVDVITYFYDQRVHSLPDNRTGFEFVPVQYDETQGGYVDL